MQHSSMLEAIRGLRPGSTGYFRLKECFRYHFGTPGPGPSGWIRHGQRVSRSNTNAQNSTARGPQSLYRCGRAHISPNAPQGAVVSRFGRGGCESACHPPLRRPIRDLPSPVIGRRRHAPRAHPGHIQRDHGEDHGIGTAPPVGIRSDPETRPKVRTCVGSSLTRPPSSRHVDRKSERVEIPRNVARNTDNLEW